MASWKDTTAGSRDSEARDVTTAGVLRPAATADVAGLRRHHIVCPALAPFVEWYWSVSWDRTGLPTHRSEVLSHPAVNLSVEDGTEPRFGVALPAVLVHGVVTRRFAVDLTGSGRVVAARFRPGGFRAFVGATPERNQVQPAAEVLGRDTSGLLRAVTSTEDNGQRAAFLDAFLGDLAPEPGPSFVEFSRVLHFVQHRRDLVRVADVADATGFEIRALQRMFRHYIGVGLKAVLARYRLQDAVQQLDAGKDVDLAALAAALGWYDQAHFSREFRAVVGVSPRAYLDEVHGQQR